MSEFTGKKLKEARVKKENIWNFKLVPEQFRLKQLQEREFYYYVRIPYQ